MRDKIEIRDLTVACIIGTMPQERAQKQNVLVNITLESDLSLAGATDDLNDTLDYSALKNDLVEYVAGSDFFLIEKLATEIAAICLRDSRVLGVRVRLEKPGALTFARSVGVDIYREQVAGKDQQG